MVLGINVFVYAIHHIVNLWRIWY